MVFSAFRFMIHGPITAAVQWKPINPRSRDPNDHDARMVALTVSFNGDQGCPDLW